MHKVPELTQGVLDTRLNTMDKNCQTIISLWGNGLGTWEWGQMDQDNPDEKSENIWLMLQCEVNNFSLERAEGSHAMTVTLR